MSEEPARLRLFVAAIVADELLQAVADEIEPLRSRFPGARWTDVANQHVTLKFLGWVDAVKFDAVSAACRSVAAGHSPASLSLGGLDAFPTRGRVRVLWVGLDDPAGLLARCAADLDAALQPLGFEPESRAFTPHLTLARFRAPLRMSGEWRSPSLPSESWTCDALTLFRSHLSPKGARYEALASFPLGAH